MATGPLLSWDIYMDHHHKMMKRMDDWQALKTFSQKNKWVVEWDLEELVLRKEKVVLVTDPRLTICFASANIADMNGYEPNEVIGKKPSLFQGEKTSPETRSAVRASISRLAPFHVTLINYRKDGSAYRCFIEGYPVFNKKKKHTHFIAFEQLLPDPQ